MSKAKEKTAEKPAAETAPLNSDDLARVTGGAEVKGSEPIQVEPFSTWEIIPTTET